MSVLMVLRVKANGEDFERVAREQGDTMRAISERGRAAGAAHHAFFAGDGEVLVVDEWDTAENFQAFFEAEGPNIGPLMAAANAEGEPEVTFYRKLDTPDQF